MHYQIAPMWLSRRLENERVLRTNRPQRCRNVLLNRSIKLVLPLSLPTAVCRLDGSMAASARQQSLEQPAPCR